MATPTRKRTTKSRKQTQGGSLTCPECGRTFTRPQGLGAHRRQAHGVIGTSPTAIRRKSVAAGDGVTAAAVVTRTRGRRKTTATARRTRAAGSANGNRQGANRDGRLKPRYRSSPPASQFAPTGRGSPSMSSAGQPAAVETWLSASVEPAAPERW